MKLLKIYDNKPISSIDHDIVVVDQRFVYDKPVTLILSENVFSFSGDDFKVKDKDGVNYFNCEGKAFDIRDKKIVSDLDNKPLFNICNNILLRERMKIYEGNDSSKVLASITPVTTLHNTKYKISFYNVAKEEEETLDMKCDRHSHSCGIFYGKEKENAPMICKIVKKINAKGIFTKKDDYFIEIAPGIDAALMVAVAICFDELKNDDSFNKKY